MNVYAVSALSASLILFAIGIFVFHKDPSNKVYRLFLTSNTVIALWLLGCFGESHIIDQRYLPVWDKFLNVFAVFSPTLFVHIIFVIVNAKSMKYVKICYLISTILAISVFTPLYSQGIRSYYGVRFITVPGPLYYFFMVFLGWCGYLTISRTIYAIISDKRNSNKFQHLLFSVITIVIAAMTYYVMIFNILIVPIDNWLNVLYGLTLAYTITRYRLMDIRIIIKKGLVYAIVTAIISALYIAIVTGAEMAYKNMPYYNVLWLTIPSILLLAVIFAPLIEIVQNAVERTVFKKQYLANQVAMRFSEGIKELMDIDELSKYITRSAIKVFKLKGAAVFIVNEETKKYECRDARGDLISFRNSVFNESDPRISAIRTTKTTLVADEMGEGPILSLMRKEGVGVLVPSISAKNGSLIGFLIGSDRAEARIFSEEDIYLLDSFGSQSCLSIENALMYRAQINEIERSIKGSRMSDLGAAAAGVAHEAKNALVSIYAVSQLLSEKKDDASFLEKTKDLVSSEVERMKILMEGVINYSEPAPLSIERQDLKEMVEATAILVRDIAKGKNISLVIGQECSRFVSADRNTMKQVFLNLFLNAIEAIGKDGTITVSCADADGSKVRIIFKDTGPGIPPGKIKKILEPFYTTKEQGTGLGLAIVKKAVEANGGSLSIESKPGEGASFIISLERG